MDDAESLVKSIVIPHTAFDKGLKTLERHINAAKKRVAWRAVHPEAKFNDSPDIVLLMGDSGTGKTFLLDQATRALRDIDTDKGWIIQHSYTKMPPKPSPITMLERMLPSYKTGESRRRSEAYLSHRVTTLITECQTVVVTIDELQHLVDRRTAKVWEHTSDVVKDLGEQTWCLYILAGLPRACGVIEQSDQLRTRVRAHIELPRFSWKDPESRAEFNGCLEGFYEGIRKDAHIPALHENEWPFRIYCATGGLMRLLANFLIELLSVHGEKKSIDLAEFADAYKAFCYSGKRPIARCSPFDKDFLSTADDEVLAAVETIGREPTEQESRQASGPRTESTPARRIQAGFKHRRLTTRSTKG